MNEKLHPNAIKGFILFNDQRYFEAHEELEIAWRAVKNQNREMYRGILQVGVAYYHIQRGNYRGAIKMFNRAFYWLDSYPDDHLGVNLRGFRHDANKAYEELRRVGQDNIKDFRNIFFRPIEYKEHQDE